VVVYLTSLYQQPTAPLGKPSAASGLPTGAWTSRRCSSQTSFTMKGADLPTPAHGYDREELNLIFRESEKSRSRPRLTDADHRQPKRRRGSDRRPSAVRGTGLVRVSAARVQGEKVVHGEEKQRRAKAAQRAAHRLSPLDARGRDGSGALHPVHGLLPKCSFRPENSSVQASSPEQRCSRVDAGGQTSSGWK
jgi:hypothetical protein